MLIRSVSGVRGLTGEDITPELAFRYARAFGALTGGAVLVGWDSRRGGRALYHAVEEGLRAAGTTVVDAGVVPTPTIGLGVRELGLEGGVVVTASHNPEEYNGLKFFSSRGVFLVKDEVEELFLRVDRTEDEEFGSAPEDEEDGPAPEVEGSQRGAGVASATGVIERHLALIESSPAVDREAVSSCAPRVAVDCVNGAGSVILPRLLSDLGCDVVELDTTPGGGFGRVPEPTPANLAGLSEMVLRSGAALGMACDPDADRLALVDENGRAVSEELTLALSARAVLEDMRGPIVVNASTSRMMDDLASEFEVPIFRTPIGEINVVSKMMDVDAVIGGEGNGGVIFPGIHAGRDAATAAALVLAGALEGGRTPLSEAVARFIPYVMVKSKIELESPSRSGIVAAMERAFPGADVDLTDGAKILWPDRWIHARMSGTEPVVRVIAEATSRGDAQELVDRATTAIAEAAGGV